MPRSKSTLEEYLNAALKIARVEKRAMAEYFTTMALLQVAKDGHSKDATKADDADLWRALMAV